MSIERSHRVRRSASDWRQILESQAASGLNRAAYCREQGLAVSTFDYWKRRLARESDLQAKPSMQGATNRSTPALIDLGTLPGQAPGLEVEIALGSGISLTLRRA